MNNFTRVLDILVEKAAQTKDNDYYDFGEDFGVSVDRKLYDRAIGVGMKPKEIADLAKKKGSSLKDAIEDLEYEEKSNKERISTQKKIDKEYAQSQKPPKGTMTDKQFEAELKAYAEGYASDEPDPEELEATFQDFEDGILPGFKQNKKVAAYIAWKTKGMSKEDIQYYYESLRDAMYDYASKAKPKKKPKINLKKG